MSYIDTSVIVAALDPLDPRQRSARIVLEDDERVKVISELVLTELASVLVRRELLLELKARLDLREELIVPTLLLYLIKRFKLEYERVDGYTKIPALGELYSPMAVALNLSTKLKLRTLDSLHIAYSKLLRDKGREIDSLITVDEELRSVVGTTRELLDIRVRILTQNSYQ